MLKKAAIAIIISAILGLSSYAKADQIVTGATVTWVTNTGSNAEMFTVSTSGGSGPCAGGPSNFNLVDAGSSEIYKRAFMIAMTAFITGSKVNIHNYVDNTCLKAVWIQIVK